MTKKIPLANPLFFLMLLFLFINPVLAEDQNVTMLNFTAIPDFIAENLNIPLFGGQLLASGIFMLIWVLPVTIIARSKHSSWIPEIASVLLTMGFCIAIGWLPMWFLLILSLIIALMYASKMREFVSGK